MNRSTEPAPAMPPRPPGMPAIRFTWRHLLFMHWPVPAAVLRPLVPQPFAIDEFEGTAWVGLIPFTMRDIRLRFLPPFPTLSAFHECNVRTYVRYGDQRGVYFFSLDAASRLAVWGARTFWHLNYVFANISLTLNDGEIHYAVQRVHDPHVRMKCIWRPGAALPQPQPGELAHFLTERYALFTVDRKDRPHRGRIHHDPWPLRSAEVLTLEDDLVGAAGIDIDLTTQPPVLHHADELSVLAWGLEPLSTID